MKHTDEYNSTVLSRELENEDSIIYSYYYYYDFYYYHVSSRVLVTFTYILLMKRWNIKLLLTTNKTWKRI